MSEHDEFLKDLENDQTRTVDVLDAPFEAPATAEAPAEPEAPAEAEEFEAIEGIKPKNRRERRLLDKLAAERESAIFLAERMSTLAEAKSEASAEGDYMSSIERIYGTETPEAILATDLLKKAIIGARDDAKAQALAEMRSERQREIEEEREATGQLESYVEDIEDTYGVRLTDTQERAYFELMRRMSPKDAEGNVTDYADPHAVWEVFQERTAKRGAPSRAKDLSARSMTPSGASQGSSLQDDSAARFLSENGII